MTEHLVWEQESSSEREKQSISQSPWVVLIQSDSIYSRNSHWLMGTVYQQIPQWNRTKPRMMSNARCILLIPSPELQQRSPTSHPRKVVMEMGHFSCYFSCSLGSNLSLVDLMSWKTPLLRLTVQICPGVTKPNTNFCQEISFKINHWNDIYKDREVHAGSFLTGIPDAEAFVAHGVIEGPVQVNFVTGAGDA